MAASRQKGAAGCLGCPVPLEHVNNADHHLARYYVLLRMTRNQAGSGLVFVREVAMFYVNCVSHSRT